MSIFKKIDFALIQIAGNDRANRCRAGRLERHYGAVSSAETKSRKLGYGPVRGSMRGMRGKPRSGRQASKALERRAPYSPTRRSTRGAGKTPTKRHRFTVPVAIISFEGLACRDTASKASMASSSVRSTEHVQEFRIVREVVEVPGHASQSIVPPRFLALNDRTSLADAPLST
jgi:hypothetical protein